jgi:hypothetical protein
MVVGQTNFRFKQRSTVEVAMWLACSTSQVLHANKRNKAVPLLLFKSALLLFGALATVTATHAEIKLVSTSTKQFNSDQESHDQATKKAPSANELPKIGLIAVYEHHSPSRHNCANCFML